MIKLVRTPMPVFFDSKKIYEEKKRIEKHYYSNSQERIKFNPSLLMIIKNDLKNLGNGKCAYCETSIGTGSSVTVDHFRPKGGAVGLNNEYAPDHYFWLAYEWDNLIPSCQRCSMSKKNAFPLEAGFQRAPILSVGETLLYENALLIDPFYDDPFQHLHFTEDGYVNGLDKKGSITIEVLDLNREPLIEARYKAIQSFKLEILSFKEMPRKMKDHFEQKITRIFSENSDYQYSAALRNLFITLEPHVKFPKKVLYPEKPVEIREIITKRPLPSLEEEFLIKDLARFTIRSIEIQNFKSIDHLHLHFLPSQDLNDKESWLLLLGDNGIGKSAILQAIALTLCGPVQFKKRKIEPIDIFKRGALELGYVKIHSYEREKPYEIQFNENKFLLTPEQAPTTLLAYGATRLLPKGMLKPHSTNASQINIANLFDYSFSLVDAKDWLLNQSEKDFETRIVPVLIDLLDIKDVIKLTRTEYELYAGKIKLSEISDGYKSMIAMACDIMQSLSLQKMRFHETTGLVLIDELGNHLHPKWRLKIVSALRLAFPKLQFIVSTHEPLCLRGLQHGEVVVLTSGDENQIVALDKSVLPDHNLLRIDQLLTSDFFGLLDTNDPETEDKFDRYYELLLIQEQDRTDLEKEEINYYTRELQDKEVIGNTPQTQVLFELINENFAKNLIQDGFKTKEELKEITIEKIQELINNKKIDWL